MSVKILVELPDDLMAALRSSPEDFVKEMRLAAAVKWYELGKLSQSRAAEMAGLSRGEFLRALTQFSVSPFQVTPEELSQEISRE